MKARDSLDKCCKNPDQCYDDNNVTSADISYCEKMGCDELVLDCFSKLHSWPTRWEDPVDECIDIQCSNVHQARGYLKFAESYFKNAVKKGREKIKKVNLKPCK